MIWVLCFVNKKQGYICTTPLKHIKRLKALYCSSRHDAYFQNKGFENGHDVSINWCTFSTV